MDPLHKNISGLLLGKCTTPALLHTDYLDLQPSNAFLTGQRMKVTANGTAHTARGSGQYEQHRRRAPQCHLLCAWLYTVSEDPTAALCAEGVPQCQMAADSE